MQSFLIVHQPDSAFTATVSSAPQEPYMTIGFANGDGGAPVPGMTVAFGTVAGERDRGIVRLKSSPTGGGVTGTFVVGENDDVTPFVEVGDHITAFEEFKLWPIYPRITGSSAFFEDYDTVYSDETSDWRPVAVPGPPAVGFLEGGQVVCNFVGNQSYALAPGATVTTYLWTADGSSEGTSASMGTPGSPVQFTWTAEGVYLVSLKVTDSNGKTHTSYTYAFVFSPDAPPDWVFTQFSSANESGDWTRGGWEADYVLNTSAPESDFPDGAMIVHAMRGIDLSTPIAGWSHRDNVRFVGWIIGNSVYKDPRSNTVAFRAQTIDGVMRNIYPFPGRLDDVTSPSSWVEGAQLSVDRIISFLARYRSTLLLMTSLNDAGFTENVAGQDFGTTSMYGQMQDELLESAWARLVSTHQGVLYMQRNANLMDASERGLISTPRSLSASDWIAPMEVQIQEHPGTDVNYIEASGIHYTGVTGTAATPMFSEAPGDAPKAHGSPLMAENKILASQGDLNTRCGLLLAKENSRYSSARTMFKNCGWFSLVPQTYFPVTLIATDTARGIVWNAVNCIPRRVRHRYEHRAGVVLTEVEFETETDGPPGVTVIKPLTPPESPPYYPPLPPPDMPEPPAGTGKRVLTAVYYQPQAAGTPVTRILATTDITIPFPDWQAIDGGGFSNEEAINGGLKLDPWADTYRAYMATDKKLYRCDNYTVDSPAWTEVLDIDAELGVTADITDFTLSIEEQYLIVVMAHKTTGWPLDYGYILCSHDAGQTWHSQRIFLSGGSYPDSCTPIGVSLDLRSDISTPKPYAYVGMKNDWTQQVRRLSHSAVGHTWSYIGTTSVTEKCVRPSVPYTEEGVDDFWWLRHLYELQSGVTASLIKEPGSVNITPAGVPTGNVRGIFAGTQTWNRNTVVLLVNAQAVATRLWLSYDGGDTWGERTQLPKEACPMAVSTFPYNQQLIYVLASDVTGDVRTNMVMYSADVGGVWQDKTGNLCDTVGMAIASAEHLSGRAVVPTWTSD